MDSFKDVLEAAQAYCKTQMAEPTYNLYIDGLEPISFEDSSHITLSVRNDFICKIVTDRYLGLLKEAFKTVLGFDVDITLVVPSTPPHEVHDDEIGVGALDLGLDGREQMGLAKAGAAVDEQRVVCAGGIGRNRLCSSKRKLVGRAFDEVFKCELVVALRGGGVRLVLLGQHHLVRRFSYVL